MLTPNALASRRRKKGRGTASPASQAFTDRTEAPTLRANPAWVHSPGFVASAWRWERSSSTLPGAEFGGTCGSAPYCPILQARWRPHLVGGNLDAEWFHRRDMVRGSPGDRRVRGAAPHDRVASRFPREPASGGLTRLPSPPSRALLRIVSEERLLFSRGAGRLALTVPYRPH